MNNIGTISSLLTLITFIMYILGKIWVIKINKKLYYEAPFELSEYNNNNNNNSDTFYVISNNPINWYKIYEIDYDKNMNIQKKHTKLISEKKNLRKNALIDVGYLTCGCPNKILVFERFDYMIGEILLQSPTYDGHIHIHGDMKHTWKSILFYLVK